MTPSQPQHSAHTPQELFAHDLTLCVCGHEKSRHDPEDGNCEAGSFPPCKCPAFDVSRQQGSDTCFCGDYRSQHRTAGCRLAHGPAGRCEHFRFSRRADEKTRTHWQQYHGEYAPESVRLIAAAPQLAKLLTAIHDFWQQGNSRQPLSPSAILGEDDERTIAQEVSIALREAGVL